MQNDPAAVGRALRALRRQVVKPCQHCGADFGPADTNRKYCSASCRQAAYLIRHPEQLAKVRERAKAQRKPTRARAARPEGTADG